MVVEASTAIWLALAVALCIVRKVPNPGESVFNDLMERLRADEAVVGFFLSGSRGKGFSTADSDYDVVIVAEDGAGTTVRERYPFRYHPNVDCVVYTLAEFRRYAALGSTSAWDRYSFAHVSVHCDRSGELQRLVDEKGRLPESDRAALSLIWFVLIGFFPITLGHA